jgi:hypothetical protein
MVAPLASCIAKTEFKQAFEAGYDAAVGQIGQCGCGVMIAPWETECYQCWQELNHASHDSQYPCDLETLR